MPSVVFREKELHYELGEHEPPEGGRHLVFLHGISGSISEWEWHLNELSWSHDTYAIDLPGHGRSGGPLFDSVQGYRDALGEFLEGMAVENAILIGHSLGAAAALALAAHNPDAIKALVLVGLGTKWKAPAAVLKSLSQAVETDGGVPFEEELYSAHASERVLQWARRQYERSRPEVLLSDLTTYGDYDVLKDAARAKQPALLVVGAEDPRVSVGEVETLADQMEDAHVEVIDRAAHFPMVEQPQEFRDALGRFLDALPDE